MRGLLGCMANGSDTDIGRERRCGTPGQTWREEESTKSRPASKKTVDPLKEREKECGRLRLALEDKKDKARFPARAYLPYLELNVSSTEHRPASFVW